MDRVQRQSTAGKKRNEEHQPTIAGESFYLQIMINSLQCDLAMGLRIEIPNFTHNGNYSFVDLSNAWHAFPLNFADHVKFDCEN